MFCNQKCARDAQNLQHRAECNPQFDQIFIDSTQGESLDPVNEIQVMLLMIYVQVFTQIQAIAQSMDRLRQLMNESSPKTIFDFDLNLKDEKWI